MPSKNSIVRSGVSPVMSILGFAVRPEDIGAARATLVGEPAVQYMMLIYADPAVPFQNETEEAALAADYQAWVNDLRKRGVFIVGDPLAPPSGATTVRTRDGKLLVTDGPFAETKEWLGGFSIIEASSLDDALEIASRCPGTKYGSVEIRPIVNMS